MMMEPENHLAVEVGMERATWWNVMKEEESAEEPYRC